MPACPTKYTILAPDLAGKEIDEGLLQPAGAGLLVVQLQDVFETQLAEGLGHYLGVFHGARDFRGQQIVFDSNDDAPRLVVQPFRLSKLRM